MSLADLIAVAKDSVGGQITDKTKRADRKQKSFLPRATCCWVESPSTPQSYSSTLVIRVLQISETYLKLLGMSKKLCKQSLISQWARSHQKVCACVCGPAFSSSPSCVCLCTPSNLSSPAPLGHDMERFQARVSTLCCFIHMEISVVCPRGCELIP